MKYFLPLLLVLFLLPACAKRKAKKQAEKDNEIILQYIKDHNLTATSTGSGLYYVIEQQGTGNNCNSVSDVTVAYRGYLTNGEVFDQSAPEGVSFNLQSVIEGWTEGIPYFREGGHGMLLIPSALAYGDKESAKIPANSVLIFDVELIDVL